MMSRHYFIFPLLFCFLLMSRPAKSQDTLSRAGFYLRFDAAFTRIPTMSGLGPLATQLSGLPERNLALSYEIAWQTDQLGVGFLYRRVNALPTSQPDFARRLALQFPDDFATIHTNGIYPKRDKWMSQTFFTLFYALEAGRWSFQPRLLLGGTRYAPKSVEVALKRHNSNQLSVLQMRSNALENVLGKTTLGAGLLIERPIWRRWSLFGTAEWTRFKSRLKYTYSLEDQVDHSFATQEFAGGKFVHFLHIGGGISFRISKK